MRELNYHPSLPEALRPLVRNAGAIVVVVVAAVIIVDAADVGGGMFDVVVFAVL